MSFNRMISITDIEKRRRNGGQNGNGNGQKMKFQIYSVIVQNVMRYLYMMTVLLTQNTQMFQKLILFVKTVIHKLFRV